MNWSRGFFRLWIAIACLWIGTATVILYQVWQDELSRENMELASLAKKPLSSLPPISKDDSNPFARFVAEGRSASEIAVASAQQRRKSIENFIYFGLLPPLVLLAVGMVIRWIVRGFLGA